ncbi:hypothetical protein HK097_008644, partial [Rhizophlyctis rosea]
MRTHTLEKPFMVSPLPTNNLLRTLPNLFVYYTNQCPVRTCGARFAVRSNCNAHSRTRHNHVYNPIHIGPNTNPSLLLSQYGVDETDFTTSDTQHTPPPRHRKRESSGTPQPSSSTSSSEAGKKSKKTHQSNNTAATTMPSVFRPTMTFPIPSLNSPLIPPMTPEQFQHQMGSMEQMEATFQAEALQAMMYGYGIGYGFAYDLPAAPGFGVASSVLVKKETSMDRIPVGFFPVTDELEMRSPVVSRPAEKAGVEREG